MTSQCRYLNHVTQTSQDVTYISAITGHHSHPSHHNHIYSRDTPQSKVNHIGSHLTPTRIKTITHFFLLHSHRNHIAITVTCKIVTPHHKHHRMIKISQHFAHHQGTKCTQRLGGCLGDYHSMECPHSIINLPF